MLVLFVQALLQLAQPVVDVLFPLCVLVGAEDLLEPGRSMQVGSLQLLELRSLFRWLSREVVDAISEGEFVDRTGSVSDQL